MGQGIHTALAQIAVEELDLDWADLEVVHGTTAVGPPNPLGTGGSYSVMTMYEPLRRTAAMLRAMLLLRAADHLDAAPDDLRLQGRYVTVPQSDRKVSLWSLAEDPGAWREPDNAPAPKKASDFTTIGQSVPRVDMRGKVTGQALYGYDMRLPGMKYGAVLRSPTIEGKLRSINDRALRDQPDTELVQHPDLIGVVAPTRALARQAVSQLDAVWDPGRPWHQAALETMVRVGHDESDAVTVQRIGDARVHLAETTDLTSQFTTPFAVQTPMEPQAALADVQPDQVRVWVSTQWPDWARLAVARALKRRIRDVEVLPTYIGGGFGRKQGDDIAVEAALLSQATGVPVHVGRDRTEELRYGFVRPPTHHRLAARLEQGRIQALSHHQGSGDVVFSSLPAAGAVLGADLGALRGARITYDIPHVRVMAWRRPLPVRTGAWRGLGLLANLFAIESFMDELALAAGRDPLEFRLDHLADDQFGWRMRRALETVATEAGWGGHLPPGHARGLACGLDTGTVVAQIAEISLEGEAERPELKVHKVTAVMDCGLAINPDGALAQLEGNIMWGVSSTLLESLRIEDGALLPGNFDTYPILSLARAPEINAILQVTGDVPYGVGEPGIGPVPGAIANAFAALTGHRIRHLPFTRERLSVALRQAG